MAIASIIVIVLNLLALAYLGWRGMTLHEDVETIIRDAISQQIRLQDDRIEKRVKRAEGQSPDALETPVDGQGRVGQPYRRRQ